MFIFFGDRILGLISADITWSRCCIIFPSQCTRSLCWRRLKRIVWSKSGRTIHLCRWRTYVISLQLLDSYLCLCWQFGGYVIATVEDRSANRKYTVRSSYLVACDGAKSPVRRHMGIEDEGEDSCMLQKPWGNRRFVLNWNRWDHDDHSCQCRPPPCGQR